jgi:hypothetical protein
MVRYLAQNQPNINVRNIVLGSEKGASTDLTIILLFTVYLAPMTENTCLTNPKVYERKWQKPIVRHCPKRLKGLKTTTTNIDQRKIPVFRSKIKIRISKIRFRSDKH